MLPETTSLDVRDSIIHWTNTEFRISRAEAEEIAAEVRRLMENPGVDGVLVDNREAEGTWPQEADEVWDGLMADMAERGIRSATICASTTNVLHINRLSRRNDTEDLIRAFDPDDHEGASEFLGAPVPA